MISLVDYLSAYTDNRYKHLKLSEERKEHLLNLDAEYGELVQLFRKRFNAKRVENLDEERERFLTARKRGLKYFPQIELEIDSSEDKDNILPRLKNLISEFRDFDCYISKFYIESLQNMVRVVEGFTNASNHTTITAHHKQTPSLLNLEAAYEMLRNHPYEDVDEECNITADEAIKRIQKHINKFKYKWTVEADDKIMSRMIVNLNRTMNVRPDAMFSEADIEGLKRHEVEAHIGRRYYGLKSGLNLFLCGLVRSGVLDEGLAIYNSLHKTEVVKPNVEFKIALKTIIAYHIDKMDFCEIFDMCKKLAQSAPDSVIFDNIIRFKRELQDSSLIGGNGDATSYFCGYQIVKDMNDEERNDILKYNVGPHHLGEINTIKQFLKINKFKSLI